MTLQADFLEQAHACETLGSPFTGKICRLFAKNLSRRCRVSQTLLDWPGDTSFREHSVPLRVASALHALVLGGKSPRLTGVYPPGAPDAPEDDIWQAIELSMLEQEDFILNWLKSPPQTNEPARSAVLRAGFHYLTSIISKPLVLSEVGASAGLNLNWDKYALKVGDRHLGPENAVLSLKPEWTGPPLPIGPEPVVLEREGCDLNPLNANDPQHKLRLLAYLWPDQPERIDRMQKALDCAALAPPPLVKADAIDWLGPRLNQKHPKAIHVIFSTVAWQYLPADSRKKGTDMINTAGETATDDSPLAYLKMEGDGGSDGASLTLQIWPGGGIHTLGRVDFHGKWIKWQMG